jgi:glutaredoxin
MDLHLCQTHASIAAFMNTITPTLYVKTGCPWCEEVLDYMDEHKLNYAKVVVSDNREAMQAMIDLSGQSKAPTMDWDGEVLADFGVDELVPFLKAHGVA